MRLSLPAALAALCLAAPALARQPVKVVEDTLVVPEGLSVDEALAAVEDLPAIFDHYEPAVPWVPGVSLELSKQVISPAEPVVMALPVQGTAFGRSIDEVAQVTATAAAYACDQGEGVAVTLAFDGSSHNVERRVDRIEITACPRTEADGTVVIDARGALYEGHLPRDPALNAFEEGVGAKALQTAFFKQVPAVFDAVYDTWSTSVAVAAPLPGAGQLPADDAPAAELTASPTDPAGS